MLMLSVLGRKNLLKAIFVAALLLLSFIAGNSSAQSNGGACGEEIAILSPADGQNLVGEEELAVRVPGDIAVQSVEFLSGDAFIGTAEDNGEGTWSMIWDTTTAGENAAEISAKISGTSNGDSTTCESRSISVSVDNSEQSEIEIELSGSEWVGPANFRFGLDAKVLVRNSGQTTDVTGQSKLQWVNDIGVLEASGSQAEFFSGPSIDNGRVTVTAYYGTLQEHAEFKVTTIEEEQALNYPFGGQDQALDACLAGVLGERYDRIVADGLRFNNGDLSAAYECFEDKNYLLPINLAPVSPVKIGSLDVNESLVIDSLEYVENQASVVSALVIKGHAMPSSDVIVYISSEPLVALARADEDGEWSYVLSDPLAPGRHEAVAVSAFEGSFYQSEEHGFSIKNSAGSANNPQGLNLEPAEASPGKPLTYLVWVAVLSLIFVIALFAVIHHRTKIHHPDHGE